MLAQPLVHVAVGVALSVAGVVHLIFALTGPPPAPHQHGAKGEESSVQQAAAEPEAPQMSRVVSATDLRAADIDDGGDEAGMDMD